LRIARTLVCAVLLVVVPAPGASAVYDPLGSGVTTLRFHEEFLASLRDQGIRLTVREGAVLKKGTLRFPVSGGKFDPTTEEGTVEHDGRAFFERGDRKISLKGLQLKTTRRRTPYAARVGGGQLKLGTARRVLVSREGFAENIAVPRLMLSAKAAARLSKRLQVRGVFEPGMAVASFRTKAIPETATVLGGRGTATLDVDPTLAAKLNDLHVAFSPIFPAERPGPFTFTIFSGRLAPDLGTGFLQLQGGLELLQLGGGQVIWSDPVLDLGGATMSPSAEVNPSPPFGGDVGQQAVVALDFSAASATVIPDLRTFSFGGAVLTLTEATAGTFNEAFAKPQGKEQVFEPGEALGRISFVAQTQ
jgi:hypothetical protein